MLILTRRNFETIVIRDDVRITVKKIDRNRVTLAIKAPEGTRVQTIPFEVRK